MSAVGMAAFSTFFMQSPSFLSHQRQLREGQGSSNCQTLFRIEHIPSDNTIRNLLDCVDPSSLYGVFDATLAAVEQSGGLFALQGLKDHILIAFDGTQYFCSNKISCSHCSSRLRSTGVREYFHTLVAACIVTPDHNRALPLAPEFIEPQDGHAKQDCELRAAERWLSKHGKRYQPLNPVYLGDDLYAHQPFCEAVLAHGGHFLFVCKPNSHKTLTEYLKGMELPSRSEKMRHGKQSVTHHWRWTNGLPIRDGDDALSVNWLELTIQNDKGEVTYRNSFITDIAIDETNVAALAKAGRARWKIENETFNVLKTKGYNLEHNFGHGKKNLAATLATLNLIAFAIHTAAELADDAWSEARKAAGTRIGFFNHLRSLTVYIIFPSWFALLNTLSFRDKPNVPI